MKKFLFTICLFFVIIIIILVVNYNNFQKKQMEIQKFNKIFEQYNAEDLNGLDITTVINKAIDNNEKYQIAKDEKGIYIADNEKSVKIYITMIINEKTYPMEKLNALGMESFIEYFGAVSFKCTDIKYHSKNGRVSEMTFEATEY